jgi:polysaccharide pyruvyl transferase WcaK-like protein
MSLTRFLTNTNLDRSLLLGFYGGGNYGDELLMEVLAGLLKKQGTEGVKIAYQQPQHYAQFHHDFGYERVDMHDRGALFGAIRKQRAIIIGGGGLWGMDVNTNIFLMSLMLLFSRWILRKKVYLLGVGFYNSAPRLGRISAWLAGKAANAIIARDTETYDNFAPINKNTQLDADMAWHIRELDLTPYKEDLQRLEGRMRVSGPTVFITLRRFNNAAQNRLQEAVAECLQHNQNKSVIVALMEPQRVDPAGYAALQDWQQQYKNVQILDFSFNPLALFLFFRKYHKQLAYVGPQFHGILSAHLAGVPYLPLAYDNKVHNLLNSLQPDQPAVRIEALGAGDIQRFIDGAYERA